MIEINNLAKASISEKWIKKIIHKALDKLGNKKLKDISVALVGDKEIKKLNKTYRGIDKITDILSFEEVNEIIVCYPQAKKQAREQKHSIKKEMEILLVHGLLHLAGYDHQTKKDSLVMRKLENKLTRSVIPNSFRDLK